MLISFENMPKGAELETEGYLSANYNLLAPKIMLIIMLHIVLNALNILFY